MPPGPREARPDDRVRIEPGMMPNNYALTRDSSANPVTKNSTSTAMPAF